MEECQVNECDFTQENSLWFNIVGGVISKNFGKRNIQVHLCDDEDAIKSLIKEFVATHPDIKTIAFSDGVTLYQLNLFDWVRDEFHGYNVLQPLRRLKDGRYYSFKDHEMGEFLPQEEYDKVINEWYEGCRQALLSDLFIISANAITLHGEIVSVDGLGNRVSGMIFGPRHVLVVVGRNKVVTDVDAAQNRIRNYVAPMTFIRHNTKHHTSFTDLPCLSIGKCADCSQPQSACRDIVIIRGQNKRHKDRIHIALINQNLGF